MEFGVGSAAEQSACCRCRMAVCAWGAWSCFTSFAISYPAEIEGTCPSVPAEPAPLWTTSGMSSERQHSASIARSRTSSSAGTPVMQALPQPRWLDVEELIRCVCGVD